MDGSNRTTSSSVIHSASKRSDLHKYFCINLQLLFVFIKGRINNWVLNWPYAFENLREKTLRRWVNVLAFHECSSIFPVLSLRYYLVRTSPLCHSDALNMFIQLRKPYKSVSAETLAQWMTIFMAAARVDTSMFKQHCTHSALAALLETGTKTMSVAHICRHAQWSNLTTTYRKFYHKVALHTEWR